jgi:hypothetical protein
LLNSDGIFIDVSTPADTFTHTFNAGAADKLIVSVHHEGGAVTNITYNGTPLTRIPGSKKGWYCDYIWYLDAPYTGGPAAVEVVADTGRGHMGIAMTSIVGSAKGYQDVATGTQTVSIGVSQDSSFVYAGFGVNQAQSVAPGGPLTPIPIVGDESMAAGAGYENGVSAGTHAYTCTATGAVTGYSSTSAAFAPRPPAAGTILIVR